MYIPRIDPSAAFMLLGVVCILAGILSILLIRHTGKAKKEE